jgi:TolB-like protein/class 3 adenylate cyclase/Tfp pilus assembly protein PilF
VSPKSHRLAALCFADIAGYTELSARDEDEAVALVKVFQGVARRAVEEHGGRIVKFIGEAVLAEFTSTGAAARSALELRDRFAADARMRGMGLPDVRAGVHIGEIVTSPDGDLYGAGVNIASRIHAAAEPGQVWVSEDVWRQLRPRREFVFESRGERELKGVDAPVALYSVRLASAAPATRETAALDGAAPDRSASGPAKRREVSTAPRKPSVAVLPFANMSPNAENEYFSDGVTEEILNLLAGVEGLKVISRTSIMRYKGTDKPMRQIGEELGVASILEGSVRQAGKRVRITAQLIDAASDAHLWAERYDRDLEDIFAIQTDVAERIVEALRVRLKPKERARLAGRPTDNLEAYQSYLKGRHFLNRRTATNLREAMEWFRKAIGADPSFAHAWAGLADAWALLPYYSVRAVPEAGAEARAAAEHALALDPGLGEVHAALGNVAWKEWRFDEAEADYRRALELAPGYAPAYLWYGNFMALRGREDEAFAAFRRALELDPVSLPVHMGFGAALQHHRRFDEAIAVYRKAIELDPGYVAVHNNLINPYLCLKRFEDALDEMETASRLGHDAHPPDFVAEVHEGYESGGERGFWEAALEGLRSRPHSRGRDYFMLQACTQLGRTDEAFALIDKLMSEQKAPAHQVPHDPLLDPLHSDPRWEKVLERLRLR